VDVTLLTSHRALNMRDGIIRMLIKRVGDHGLQLVYD